MRYPRQAVLPGQRPSRPIGRCRSPHPSAPPTGREKPRTPRFVFRGALCAFGRLKFRFSVLLPVPSFPRERNRLCVSTPYSSPPPLNSGRATNENCHFTPISHPFHTHFPGVAVPLLPGGSAQIARPLFAFSARGRPLILSAGLRRWPCIFLLK